MRPFSIEEMDLSNNRANQSFTYNILRLQKYRRALILLNNQDIDHEDERMLRELPQLDARLNIKVQEM